MRALCIDPGTRESGTVVYSYSGFVIEPNPAIDNEKLLEHIKMHSRMDGSNYLADLLIIEMVSSYGMAVGKEVFETCVWIGRFMQAFGPENTRLVYRRDVKMHLCNSMRAKDANIRQAVIDKFPADGGGKVPQIGTKSKPGPLYGVTKHAMPALALGITYFETVYKDVPF